MSALAPSSSITRVFRSKTTIDSNILAKHLGVAHKNVRQTIRGLIKKGRIDRLACQPIFYLDSYGREQPADRLSADGFAAYAHFMRGQAEAATFELKLQLIEHEIGHRQEVARLKGTPQWQTARIEGKAARRTLTDTIQCLEQCALEAGSVNGHFYFTSITKLVNESVVETFGKEAIRESCSDEQLGLLDRAEAMAAELLDAALEATTGHREAYAAFRDAFLGWASAALPSPARPSLVLL